jgi:hypothetical protein
MPLLALAFGRAASRACHQESEIQPTTLVSAFHEKADPCQEFFSFRNFFLFPRSAKPPLSPPFHPHSLLSDCRSVQVGCTRFSRCCYLIIDLGSPFRRELVQALSQSPDLGGRARLFLDTISLLFFFFSLLLFLSSCLSQLSTEKFRAMIA